MDAAIFWTAMVALDCVAFLLGAVVWSSIRSRLLSESVIKLQKDVINLQGMNLLLNQELATMRNEITQLREQLGAEQSAARHFRNNVAQVFQTSRDLRDRDFDSLDTPRGGR